MNNVKKQSIKTLIQSSSYAYLAYVMLLSSFMFSCAPSLKDSLNSSTLTQALDTKKPIRIDIEASEIRWNPPVNIDQVKPKSLRRTLAHGIERVLNGSNKVVQSKDYLPGRYLLEVHSLHQSYVRLLFPCFFYFTFFGCPYISIDAEITLTLDLNGQFYEVSTSGQATYSIYETPPLTLHTQNVRSVGVAIQKALNLISSKTINHREKVIKQ
jgi:hypothetical protein